MTDLRLDFLTHPPKSSKVCARCGKEGSVEDVRVIVNLGGGLGGHMGSVYYKHQLPTLAAKLCPNCLHWLKSSWPFTIGGEKKDGNEDHL